MVPHCYQVREVIGKSLIMMIKKYLPRIRSRTKKRAISETILKKDCYFQGSPRHKVIFSKGNSKGKNSSREIPTHLELNHLLLIYLESSPKWRYSDHFFPERGGFHHLNPKSASKIFKDACLIVKLEGGLVLLE